MPTPQARRNQDIPTHAVITEIKPCPRAWWDKRAIAEYSTYKPGMTVAEYYEACAQLPRSNTYRAKCNVQWDVSRGNITVNY